MPRPPGPLNDRDSYPVGVRVPRALYRQIFAACGGTEEGFKRNFPSWARAAFSTAVGEPRGGNLGDAHYEEGRKAGWSHANRVFREALQAAAEKLKGAG